MAFGEGSWQGLVFQCLTMAVLGILVSHLLAGKHSTSHKTPPGDHHQLSKYGSCEAFISSTRLPEGMRLGSKTPYHFPRGRVKDESHLEGCTAVQLYAVIRHGTRFPTDKYVGKWNAFQRLVRERLSGGLGLSRAAETVRGWENPFVVDHGEVTEEGMWEQFCLGKRFMERFPHLLQQTYTDEAFSFRTTQTARTVRSALSFAYGMLEGRGPLHGYEPILLESESRARDDLLRFFDLPCPLHDYRVARNETLSEMLEQYLESDKVQSVVEHVQSQLDPGHSRWNLTASIVMTMYKICIHEMAVFRKSSWCSLFTDEDMLALEYYVDMKTYWKRGYGFDINWKRSLPLVRDILQSFHNYSHSIGIKYNIKRAALFRFAHTETIIPVTSFFHLFNDKKPLLPSNYADLKGRQFTVSSITPFSGNIVFVLYDCSGAEGGAEREDDFRVRLLVNEAPVQLPGCPHRTMCSLAELLTEIDVVQDDPTLELELMCQNSSDVQ